MLQNLPIMLSGISFFLAYYSPTYAHIFTHYNTVIYVCEPNFRNVDSGLAVFRVRGCSIEVKDWSIKVRPSALVL